jgi:hypothetical protein
MKQHNFIKYYRVFEHDTLVTEISSNDFKPLISKQFKKGRLIDRPVNAIDLGSSHLYSLPTDGTMFYGYPQKAQAMKMAKAGALKYIDLLISQADSSASKLNKYRTDHYDDLNVNLVDANIRKAENELNIKL